MPPLLLAQKGIDWRVQCEHHKIQVFKSPENGTKTSHRYKIDHNRALKGMCDCLMAVQVFREALQKTGVNIKPILLRLKDRQKSVIDRN